MIQLIDGTEWHYDDFIQEYERQKREKESLEWRQRYYNKDKVSELGKLKKYEDNIQTRKNR